MIRTDRGLSSALSYALMAGVTLILAGGLIVGSNAMIAGQQEPTVREQLHVVGEGLADSLQTADRLTQQADASVATISHSMPGQAAGAEYAVDVSYDPATETGAIRLESHSPEVEITVGFKSRTVVRETRIEGGDARIEYDDSSDELVVHDA